MNIPRECMPIVRLLRKLVKRPRFELRLTKPWCVKGACRFSNDRCPMGLFPKATCCPMLARQCNLPNRLDRCVESFYLWWDSLTLSEAREAVEVIWPKVKS